MSEQKISISFRVDGGVLEHNNREIIAANVDPARINDNIICTTHNITQSMSRADCPYNNAPMERYFNTLKSELIYQHTYVSESKLFSDIDDYFLLWYNSVRSHSFNNGLTPWQKRSA